MGQSQSFFLFVFIKDNQGIKLQVACGRGANTGFQDQIYNAGSTGLS